MNSPRSLFKTLLFTPIIIILLAFVLVMSSFHFVMKTYIHSLTDNAIREEFSIMDAVFKYPNKDTGLTRGDLDEEGLVVNVQHLFFDKDMKLVVPRDFWFSKEEEKSGRRIGEYISKLENLDVECEFDIKIGARTYVAKMQEYMLSYDNGIVNSPEEGKNTGKYYILIYTDITSLDRILKTIDFVLAIILVMIGMIATIVMLRILGRVRLSFGELDNFLQKIGKKEVIETRPVSVYKEFDNIVNTTYDMQKEIRKSEDVQKKFFQNASHELRTPLMSIQGYTEGLKCGVVKDIVSAYDIILEESSKMKDLVDEILFLSKFEAGNIEKEELDISELLYSTADSLYGLIEKNNIKVTWDMDRNIYMVASEKFLMRAFYNIISNAVRYAKSELRISARVVGSGLHVEKSKVNYMDEVDSIGKTLKVEIHIIDDGPGIALEDQPHIFERFYKGKGGNFGIGLSMAKDIIDQHGGNISIESREGRTDFKIIL